MDGERVTLRDGSTVVIRPVQPDDKELFVAGWAHSARSRATAAVRETGESRMEIDVELPCEPASGLGAVLRAAARGLVRLRP